MFTKEIAKTTGQLALRAAKLTAIFFQGENPAVYGGREALKKIVSETRKSKPNLTVMWVRMGNTLVQFMQQ
jgi:hypothetical protein